MRLQRPVATGIPVALLVSLAIIVASPTAAGAADALVVGRVVDADGAPVAASVQVVAADTGIDIPLVAPAGPSRVVQQGSTDAGGGYRAALPGAYVAGTETDTDWIVTASLPASGNQLQGPVSSFEFEVNTATQEAPALPLWTVTPRVSQDGWMLRANIPGTPPGQTGEPVVVANGLAESGTAATIDLRVFEDVDPLTEVEVAGYASADLRVPHREGRTIYHQRVRSPIVAVPIDAPLRAASRGAGCEVVLTDGTRHRPAVCPATDGNPRDRVTSGARGQPRSSGSSTTTTEPPTVASVTVFLPETETVATVFAHGCNRECRVEVSGDGAQWTTPRAAEVVASPAGPFFRRGASGGDAGPPLARQQAVKASFDPGPIGFVRVTRDGGRLDLTEISAWPAEAAPPAQPPGDDLRPDPGRRDPSDARARSDVPGATAGRRPEDDGAAPGRVAPASVALALVISVGVGLAFTVRRPRDTWGRP